MTHVARLVLLLAATVLPLLALGDTHIVVPCYNEEARLPRIKFLDFTADARNAGIIFTLVNDGSTDGTMDMIKELASERPGNIFGLDLVSNRGKAEAVRLGMQHVIKESNLDSHDSVGFWDADLATPLESIPDFTRVLQDRPELEMVFGARVALLGRDIRRKADRHYLGRVFATLASMVLNLRFIVTKIKSGGKPCEDVIYEYPLEQWHDVAGSKLSFTSKVSALYGLGSVWYNYFSYWATWQSFPPTHGEL